MPLVLNITSFPADNYLAEHKQLVEDWTTQPYIDIKLVDHSLGCPNDYEPLLSRKWNGTYDVCVEDSSLKKHENSGDAVCRGKTILGISPVEMTSV